MSQTVGSTTVSYIRSVMKDTDSVNVGLAEKDHATKIDSEITAVGAGSPTSINTTIGRTPNGRVELATILIWI